MTFVQVEDPTIVEALWHLLAPNSEGAGAVERVPPRALLRELKERYPLAIDGSKVEERELVNRLYALQDRNRVVVHPSTKGELTVSLPVAPEDGMYRLVMTGTKHTYSFRGSQEHTAKVTASTVSDLLGFRADYIETLFIAPLNVGKSRKIKRDGDMLAFVIERVA